VGLKSGERLVARTRFLAFAGGLIVGGFLFYRFGWDDNTAFAAWGWYLSASFLAGVGLAGVFPATWRSAAAGLALGPVLFETAVIAQHVARDSTCCNLWPIGLAAILFLSLPGPLLGGVIGVSLLRRKALPAVTFPSAIAIALVIGGLLPHFQQASLRRLEKQTVPQLLREIHDAEMAYSASQPNGLFACEGTALPGAAGRLAWYPAHLSERTSFFTVGEYSVTLECLNDAQPRGFRLRAAPSYPAVRADRLSMDQSGVLVIIPVQ
jgi:hypothetical protein